MLRHVYSPSGTMGALLPSLTSFAFELSQLMPRLWIEHLKVSGASQIALKRSLGVLKSSPLQRWHRAVQSLLPTSKLIPWLIKISLCKLGNNKSDLRCGDVSI